MIEQITQLKTAKSTKQDYPCLFDGGNIEAMYRLMDPEGRGFITSAQFAEGNSAITKLIVSQFTVHTKCFALYSCTVPFSHLILLMWL